MKLAFRHQHRYEFRRDEWRSDHARQRVFACECGTEKREEGPACDEWDSHYHSFGLGVIYQDRRPEYRT